MNKFINLKSAVIRVDKILCIQVANYNPNNLEVYVSNRVKSIVIRYDTPEQAAEELKQANIQLQILNAKH